MLISSVTMAATGVRLDETRWERDRNSKASTMIDRVLVVTTKKRCR